MTSFCGARLAILHFSPQQPAYCKDVCTGYVNRYDFLQGQLCFHVCKAYGKHKRVALHHFCVKDVVKNWYQRQREVSWHYKWTATEHCLTCRFGRHAAPESVWASVLVQSGPHDPGQHVTSDIPQPVRYLCCCLNNTD